MPSPGLEPDGRLPVIVVSAYRVSPTNTGAVSRTLSQPRLAIAFWLTVFTVIPLTTPKVTRLDTSSFPNEVCAA